MAGVVSTVLVLRRGVAKELPDKYEASPDELRESRATTLGTLRSALGRLKER